MSVQISELEVVPRPGLEAQRGQQAVPPPPPSQQPPSPELEQEIARTVALLRARDLRLRAD